MAQTYTRTVQYTGDSNPNGDNYTWLDVNGAQAAGWIILTQQSGTDSWDFEVQDWNGGTGTRQAEFKIQHWLYTDDTDTTKWDSFLITQYALDGAVTTTEATTTEATTTEATTTEATTTQATTVATTTEATIATTTAATTQQQYTVTIGANSTIANASIYNVASGGSPNNTITRTGVAGQGISDAFYVEANSGYNISPSQVSITSWGGGGSNYYVDSTVNSAGRVVVGWNDSLDPNNLSFSIGIGGSVSQIQYTAEFYQTNNAGGVCDGTVSNLTMQYPQGQGGANFKNYIQNELQVPQGTTASFKVISSNEPNFAWNGWAITLNDQNESSGGWFNCANQTTTSSGGGSGTTSSGGGSGATTILPSSVSISGEEWIYTMGGPEDYTATVANLTNPTYSWSLTGNNTNKFLLTNETSQVCTLEFIWTTPCDGGGLNADLNVSVTGTNSQGQTVTVGATKGVNGCDDSGEDESS